MSDKALVITESDILKRFDEMCQESLSPEVYSIWADEIIPALNKVRLRLEKDKTGTEFPWRVQLLSPTEGEPFRKLDCKIVDVGYSDSILVVEVKEKK